MAGKVRRVIPVFLLVIVLALSIALPVAAVDLPEATTRYATFITETTARLNGFVDDDGGEACDVRFNYYMEGGAWDDNLTAWVTGYVTGDSPYVDVSALTVDKIYYYRVEIRNSIGAVEADGVAFTAYKAPTMPRTWFSGPNVAKWDATLIGDLANLSATSLSMPVGTIYFTSAMLLCISLGIAALIIGKRLIPAVIVLAGALALCSLAELLPMFFVVFSLILILGAIKMGHPREE